MTDSGLKARPSLIAGADLSQLGAFLERFDYAVVTLGERCDVEESFFGLGKS